MARWGGRLTRQLAIRRRGGLFFAILDDLLGALHGALRRALGGISGGGHDVPVGVLGVEFGDGHLVASFGGGAWVIVVRAVVARHGANAGGKGGIPKEGAGVGEGEKTKGRGVLDGGGGVIAPGGRQVRKTIESEVTESHVGRSGSRWWGRKGDDGGIEEGNKRREFQRGEKRQGCVGVEQDKGGGKVRGVEVAGARGRRLPRNQCRGQGRGGGGRARDRLGGIEKGYRERGVAFWTCVCVCVGVFVPPQKKKGKKRKGGGGLFPIPGQERKGKAMEGGGGGRGTTGWLCPCVICPPGCKKNKEKGVKGYWA